MKPYPGYICCGDFVDAFHTLAVTEEERKHQVVRGEDGDFRVYDTVVFGGGGSPLVWGRAAAYLGRSGQGLYDKSRLRMQIFVDDPLIAVRGTAAERKRMIMVLLCWWLVLGLDMGNQTEMETWFPIISNQRALAIQADWAGLAGKLLAASEERSLHASP